MASLSKRGEKPDEQPSPRVILAFGKLSGRGCKGEVPKVGAQSPLPSDAISMTTKHDRK